MNSHEKHSTSRPRDVASTHPPAAAANESEHYHFQTVRYGGFNGSRPYRLQDRDRLQAKLDRRFGPGAFVLRDDVLAKDARAIRAGLLLAENPARPRHPDAVIARACAVVTRHLGPPHAVTRTVSIENRAELTAWSRLAEMRQSLPDHLEVSMQPGPTPNSVVYQITTAPDVDPHVRATLAAAAAAPTHEQNVAKHLRECSRASDESRDPDGTQYVEGYDPIREYSIDQETSVLNNIADQLEDGTLTLFELDQELLRSPYYDDHMGPEQVRQLSDRDLGYREGERHAWGDIARALRELWPYCSDDPLAAPIGDEEPPDPGVAGAGGDGPLPADATWTDYVDAHGGPDTSGWWVTLDWIVDSAPQPEVVGPYSSYWEAVSAMQDSPLIDGFVEDTKRSEVLDDVYVDPNPSTITRTCDRYGPGVTLIDPHDPNHFGISGRPTPPNPGARSSLLQTGALHTPPAPAGRPPAAAEATETVTLSPSPPGV